MEKSAFAERLTRASSKAREFASRYVTNFLPDASLYIVELNASYDGNPLANGEKVFPEDTALHGKRTLPLSASEVLELLWREGRVPEWIDVSVKRVVESETHFRLICCGRFTDRDEILYYRWTDCAPFGIKSPYFPSDWSTTKGRFDLNTRQFEKPKNRIPVLFLLALPLFAAEQRTDGCNAMDSKHYVVMVQPNESEGEYELEIRSVDADKTLFSRPAGGYAKFNASTWPANFKCLWSPNSKLVAIFERGTKRTGDTTLYFVNEDKVQEIAFPDLMSLIRPHLTTEMRAMWVRPEVWLPDNQLILSVEGMQLGEEHANFRFILTLQLHTNKAGKLAAGIISFRQDKSIPFPVN